MDYKEKEVQIKMHRGLWKASSYVRRLAKKLRERNRPIRIHYLLQAHRNLFSESKEKEIGGKYREDNPKLERIDGTKLPLPSWREVPSQMAILNEELINKTSNISSPLTKEDCLKMIKLATKTSHRLAVIHPFYNGNGRISRLLINFILLRVGLSSVAFKEEQSLKEKYYGAMLQADKGDYSALMNLIVKGVIRTQQKKVKKQESLLRKDERKPVRIRRSDFDKT